MLRRQLPAEPGDQPDGADERARAWAPSSTSSARWKSQGLLDRQIEFLPTDAELAERKARGQGLTRPELSVLLSYSKIVLFQQLLDSDVPEDPYLSKELVRYFPKPLQEKYAKAMEKHRLKREIIATAVTNSMVNRMGATFTAAHAGRHRPQRRREIAKAYTIAREVLDARALWAQIDALDGKVPESVQIDALQVIWHAAALVHALAARRARARCPTSPPRWRATTTASTTMRVRLPGVLPGFAAPGVRRQRAATGRRRACRRRWPSSWPRCRTWSSACDIIEIWRWTRKLRRSTCREGATSASARRCTCRGCSSRSSSCRSTAAGTRVARGVLRDELATQQRALVAQVLADAGQTTADAKVAALARARRRVAALHPGDVRRDAQPEDAGLPDRCRSRCGAWRSWRRAAGVAPAQAVERAPPIARGVFDRPPRVDRAQRPGYRSRA